MSEELGNLKEETIIETWKIKGNKIVRSFYESMGVESMGVESMGVESMGVESMGVESMGVESLFSRTCFKRRHSVAKI
jgi:hypothetical protein